MNRLRKGPDRDKCVSTRETTSQKSSQREVSELSGREIAIVGVACRFPKADGYDAFWQNLIQGVNSISEIPSDRWDLDTWYSPVFDEPNKSVSKWCGLIDGIDRFDNRFFNISAREARNMDPQQRLLLEETWRCIEDAGIAAEKLRETTTGVYVGVMAADYQQEVSSPGYHTDSYAALGNYDCILANRISYIFGLRGPSVSVGAACASSLVAVHKARKALLGGECQYALAAGVSLDLHPWKYISFSKARMLSPDGQCKTFDKDANGYVPGEGIGVLLLQTLKDAVTDGNRIYGVIKGSAVNHGGKTLSITAPRVQAQKEVILAAYKDAGFSPETVTYTEAHGTGTSLGDPIEVESLNEAFREYTDRQHFCHIGSVKTNIGHLEATAGIAGIVKLLMMMRHRKIPKLLNVNTLNPIINFAESPLKPALQVEDWEPALPGMPLRAGVSSFGFGGVNAHALLESYDPQLHGAFEREPIKIGNEFPFILSARTQISLEMQLKAWQTFVTEPEFQTLEPRDISGTLLQGRTHFKLRLGFDFESIPMLVEKLKSLDPSQALPAHERWGLCIGTPPFLGDLTKVMDQLHPVLAELVAETLPGLDPSLLAQPRAAQILMGVLFFEALEKHGFTPDILTGEGDGKWVALAATGILSLADTLTFAIEGVPDGVELRRPKLPFQDPVSHRPLLPVSLNGAYLDLLIDGLDVPLPVLKQVVLKARLLCEVQFTFKRHLEEWTRVLHLHERDLDALLFDETLLHDMSPQLRRDRILLFVVICASLHKLNRKWDLSLPKLPVDPRLDEILDLVLDGVMNLEHLTALLCQETPDTEMIALELVTHQKLLDKTRPYPLLRGHNSSLLEVGNPSDWLRLMLETPGHDESLEDLAWLMVGAVSPTSRKRVEVHAQCKNGIENCLEETLHKLWLAGVDIDWEQFMKPQSFARIALPGYSFDRASFWLTPHEEQGPVGVKHDTHALEKVLALLAEGKLSSEDLLTVLEKENPTMAALDLLALYEQQASIPDTPITGDRPEAEQARPEAGDAFCFQPEWVEETNQSAPSGHGARHALVFHQGDTTAAKLSGELALHYQQVLQVQPGSEWKQEGRTNFKMDPDNEDHFLQLVEAFVSGNQAAEAFDIYFLWAADRPGPIRDLSSLLECGEAGTRSLFYLARALGAMRLPQKTNILIAVRNVAVVMATDKGEGYAHAGLSGLCASIARENPRLSLALLDLGPEMGDSDLANLLLSECHLQQAMVWLAWRKGRRYRRTMVATQPGGPVRLREKGTWLIIGGAGGIGYKLAAILAQESKARLVIVGLSPLSEARQKQLHRLEDLGAEVCYQQADVSDIKQLEQVLLAARGQFGEIHGVIHAGGVLEDKLLLSKEWSSFKRVISAKVNGAFLLDQLTRNEPLDYFVVFSSVVAVTGNAGQVDYACANAFLDGFMHFRNRAGHAGRSLSINWTLWADGGMGLHPSVVQAFSRRAGVISSEQGLQVFNRLLGGKGAQVVVVGNPEGFLRETSFGADPAQNQSAQTRPAGPDKTRIMNGLTEILGGILEVEAVDLDPKTDMREFGLDSVAMIELAQKISTRYQVDVNPAMMFDCDSIHALAEFVLTQVPVPDQDLAQPPQKPATKPQRDVRAIDLHEPLTGWLAEILEMGPTQLDGTTDLREFGMDSVSLTEFADRIARVFAIDFNSALLFDYTTINAVAAFIAERFPKEAAIFVGIPQTAITPEPAKKPQPAPIKIAQIAPKLPPRGQYSNGGHSGEIAIVGISGRFPGSNNVTEFWENLITGRDSVGEVPADRWDWRAIYGDPHEGANRTRCKWGGFLDNVRRFDAAFFNISPREAELMDPQQRLMLETTWKCLEDAGISPASLSGSDTGLFVGVCNADYNELLVSEEPRLDAYRTTGAYYSIIPNRISYLLNIHGPSVAVDTACSSSLVALHQAVRAIQNGDCSKALVGAVNLLLSPKLYISLSHAGMLSPEGRCKTFDEAANGYVRADGVGALFLEPLEEALKQGHHVYGLVKGSAINHGGYANSLTAPNPRAQAGLLVKAWTRAGVDPSTVGYIEAHGTGTSLGDPIEFNGLGKAFKQLYEDAGKKVDQPHIGLGSVKSNIGHAESAAGIAGLIKVLMSFKHRTLPATLHFHKLNGYISLENTPFFINRENRPWPVVTDAEGMVQPRRAGVSSFGFGGVNGHVVLEAFHNPMPEAIPGPHLFLLSARNEDRLAAYVQSWISWLEEHKAEDTDRLLGHICHTLQVGRDCMNTRLACVISNSQQLLDSLKTFGAKPGKSQGLYQGNTKTLGVRLDQLLAGEEAEGYLNFLLENRRLTKIAELWTAGAIFDWLRLYNNLNVQRVNGLPTYPFAPTEFWLPAVASVAPQQDQTRESGLTSLFLLEKFWLPDSFSTQRKDQRVKGLRIVLANDQTQSLAKKLTAPGMELVIHNEIQNEQEGAEFAFELIARDLPLLEVIDLSDLYRTPQVQEELNMGRVILFRELIKARMRDGLYLLHLTNGLAEDSAEKATLAGSIIAGMVKTLGAEYSRINARTIDIDLDLDQSQEIETLIRAELELVSDCGEIRYRQNQRLVSGFRNRTPGDQPMTFGPEEVVVITGGTRGIGAKVAAHLVSAGVRKLAILGRTEMPPREQWAHLSQESEKIAFFHQLEVSGVALEIYGGSLSDGDSLHHFFNGVKQRLGKITLVIHSAGAVDNDHPAFIHKQPQQIAHILEPKVRGLQNLWAELKDQPIRRFLCFSSVSAQVPLLGAGLVDYAAANAFMDFYASWQRNQGNSCFQTVCWPSWKDTGMGEIKSATYLNLGFLAHATPTGLEMLDQVLATGECVTLMPCLASQNFKPEQLTRTRINEPTRMPLAQSAPAVRTAKPEPAPAKRPEAGATAQSVARQWLQELFCSELKIPMAELDPDTDFGEFGVDSILLADFVKKIEKWLKADLEPSALLEQPTFNSMAEYLAAEYPEQLGSYLQTDSPISQPSRPPEVSPKPTVNPPVHQQRNPEPALSFTPSAVAPGKTIPVAIIGMGCRFPDAPDLQTYWNNLLKGHNAIREVPSSRWDVERFYSAIPQKGKSISKWGGFVEGLEYFDARYFGLDDETARHTDPLVRLFLETSVQTFRHAGYEKTDLGKRRVGVFVGSRVSNYAGRVRGFFKQSVVGLGQNFIAAHISHLFNLKGPNLVVDTACSSSLVSLHLACQSLASGESEMALAGGVDVLLDENSYLMLSEGGALSPDGRCFTFDQRANGFVPGEGSGAVLLKRLDRAIADGDRIYAVIESSAVNNDGQTMGITTPNPEAQYEVIRDAIERGGINPRTISYLETHGTGTMIGDPIELKALTRVFRQATDDCGFCAVGSVKTNMGHLLSAAGIAGVIKVALSLSNRQLPPTLNCETPNKRFNFAASPFYPVTRATEWTCDTQTRRAGISSFGFGGTNAHLILAEPVQKQGQTLRSPLPPVVFDRKRYWLDEAAAPAPLPPVIFNGISQNPATNLPALLELFDEEAFV